MVTLYALRALPAITPDAHHPTAERNYGARMVVGPGAPHQVPLLIRIDAFGAPAPVLQIQNITLCSLHGDRLTQVERAADVNEQHVVPDGTAK